MTQKLPFFSIIIPSYNRPQSLTDCLESIAHLDYPEHRLEVIVVDDGGRTPLQTVVGSFRDRLDISLLEQENAGAGAARAVGARYAKGEFLVFTDDDCVLAEDYLSVLAQEFLKTPDRMMGGRVLNQFPNILWATASHLILHIVYRHYNADPQNARLFGSASIVIPAQIYREIGGFDPNLRISEDREFCDRWRFHGYQMTYLPEARVYHGQHLTSRQFCKQHFNYGRGAYHFHQARAERSSGTLRDEMKFHRNCRNLLLYPFTQVRLQKALPLAGALLLWQCMNAAGFFYETLSQRLMRRRT